MPKYKIKRIESDIQKYISEIVNIKARDELLKTITITSCSLSNDLSYCKVYFTSVSDLPKKEIEHEVNEASSYIRVELSNMIDIRHTPELKFIYDESIEYGKKIESIISAIHEE